MKPTRLTGIRIFVGGKELPRRPEPGPMARVRDYYSVPAKRGGRVLYTDGDQKEYGTITSARGLRLMIRLDKYRLPMPFHPTWGLEYLPREGGKA